MKTTKDAWIRLSTVIVECAESIYRKSHSLGFNVEESAKNGGTETVILMIVELESDLRVLKRRLIQSLPPEEQSKWSPV